MKKNILLLLLCFIFPIEVSAYCSEMEINNFEKIKSKIKVTLKYNESTKLSTFRIYSPEWMNYRFYFSNIKADSDCKYVDNNKYYECVGYGIGDSIDFSIKLETDTCNEILMEKTINREIDYGYNIYSENELCDGIEDFVLCQRDYSEDIEEDDFRERVEIYRENINKNNSIDEKINIDIEKQKNFNKTSFETWLKDKLFLIISFLIFLILIIINIILYYKNYLLRGRLE